MTHGGAFVHEWAQQGHSQPCPWRGNAAPAMAASACCATSGKAAVLSSLFREKMATWQAGVEGRSSSVQRRSSRNACRCCRRVADADAPPECMAEEWRREGGRRSGCVAGRPPSRTCACSDLLQGHPRPWCARLRRGTRTCCCGGAAASKCTCALTPSYFHSAAGGQPTGTGGSERGRVLHAAPHRARSRLHARTPHRPPQPTHQRRERP